MTCFSLHTRRLLFAEVAENSKAERRSEKPPVSDPQKGLLRERSAVPQPWARQASSGAGQGLFSRSQVHRNSTGCLLLVCLLGGTVRTGVCVGPLRLAAGPRLPRLIRPRLSTTRTLKTQSAEQEGQNSSAIWSVRSSSQLLSWPRMGPLWSTRPASSLCSM